MFSAVCWLAVAVQCVARCGNIQTWKQCSSEAEPCHHPAAGGEVEEAHITHQQDSQLPLVPAPLLHIQPPARTPPRFLSASAGHGEEQPAAAVQDY